MVARYVLIFDSSTKYGRNVKCFTTGRVRLHLSNAVNVYRRPRNYVYTNYSNWQYHVWITLMNRQKWAFTHRHFTQYPSESVKHLAPFASSWPLYTINHPYEMAKYYPRHVLNRVLFTWAPAASIMTNMHGEHEGHTALLDKNNTEINSSSWGLPTLYKSVLLTNVHVFRDIHTTLKPHTECLRLSCRYNLQKKTKLTEPSEQTFALII